MFHGDNGREDQTVSKGVSREEEETLTKQGENVRKVFDDVQDLKEKIERLKTQTEKMAKSPAAEQRSGSLSDTPKEVKSPVESDAVRAAERAVLEHARWDGVDVLAEHKRREADKEIKIKEARLRELEAQERLLQKQKEAIEKQQALKEAEKRVAESKIRRRETEEQAEIRQEVIRQERLRAAEKHESEERRLQEVQRKIEREIAEAERIAAAQKREHERLARERAVAEKREQERIARERAAAAKKEQERIAREMAAAEKKREQERRALERAAAAQKREQERIARERAAVQQKIEREKIAGKKAEEKRKIKEAERLAAIERKKEAARLRQEAARENRKKKEARAELIAEQRAIQRRKREEEKAEQRRLKKIQADKKNEDRQLRKEAIKKKRAERKEIKRQQRLARELAKKGGGIVNVHGQTIQTEIHPVPAFSISDLLGTAKRREIRRSKSEEEKRRLRAESERIKAEAARTAATLAAARKERRKNKPLAVKINKFLSFCDEKRRPLMIGASMALVFAVGTAAVFNYFTAYEYSYSGNALGYVKSKDDVLQITGMVQGALSEEKNVDVVIDAREDINFNRVSTFNKDLLIDSSDDVLRRLTYLNEINVKAYGIFLDGRKIGAVKDKDAAAKVFEEIQDRYAGNAKGTEIKEAVIIEKVDTRKSNTPLGEVLSEEQMVNRLCTDSLKETVVTVKRGQTLDEIAKLHSVSKEKIIKDNPQIDPDKPAVGSTLVLHETAPLMTVQIIEERTYVEKTPYKTIKKKDKDLYEGYTEVDQKGHKGISKVKDRTVSVNGKVVETEVLKSSVKKEPVEKIIRVGTKERPPTVGSGTYIWPANEGTFRVTSEFKWRWGRQHQGIDMGCATGNDVLASDGGTVVHAGWMGGYGNLVIIDHQNGMKTYYAHNSSLLVRVGDKVFQGQHIAEAGNTGRSFGSHIHFGVMDHGTFKNPRNYLP